MKFSKRNKCLLFALLTILNIVFRLPVTTHEIGKDSFFIHTLATTISTYGYAGWIIHPVSFTGLYPFSYASASPFFISGMSQITDITTEYIILYFCILLGIFSVFATFLFAKEVIDDDAFAFLVAFIFSLSPNFLRFTMWDATTRSLFMVFLPLLLWALIKCGKSFSGKYVGIAIVSFIFLSTSHRVVLFMPIIFIAFIAAVILTRIHQKVKHSRVFSNLKILNKLSFLIFPVALLLLFFVQFSGIGFYNKWVPDYYSGYLFNGEELYIVLLNVAIDYLGKVSFVLLFGLIGFISLARTAFNGFGRLFILLSVLSLTPFLVIEDYTPVVILPFFSILAGFGLLSTCIFFFSKRQKRIAFSILAICLIASTGFSWFMLDHWRVYAGGMSEKTYATASFLSSDKANGTSIANVGVIGAQISAFSGKSCLPYGSAYPTSNSPLQLAYGSVKADEVGGRLLAPQKIIRFMKVYEQINALPNAKDDWVGFFCSHPWADKTKILRSRYDVQYVVEDYRCLDGFWFWGKKLYSRLLMSLEAGGNKIYANGMEDIWHLESK